ncbi:MAG: hypothetical protein E7137_01785 [Rikenellaceae bacterium]|nr:hypothetical protein [Rikenellaceae bacterium]
MRKGIKILAKMISTLLLVAIFLPVLLALMLQLEGVQSHLARRVTVLASEKLGVQVGIDRLKIGFFNRVELEGFYVEDFDCDTLLYARRLEASIANLGLLGGDLCFEDVLLQEAKFHLRESSRGVMNIKEVVDRLKRKEPREKKEPFGLLFRHLEFEQMEFWLKRNAPRRHDYGINWADMRLMDMWGRLDDFSISGPEISGVLDHLTATEQTGFRFDDFSGHLFVGPGRIALAGARILTPESELNITSLDLSGNDWSEYKYFVERVNMEAQFEHSSLSTNDVAYFAPSLRDWHLEARDIDLDVSGTVSSLTGKIWNLETAGGSRLRADLYMRGLPEAKRTRFDLKLHSLRTHAEDARTLSGAILRKALPDGVTRILSRAGKVELSGRFSGLLSDFTARAIAATGVGTLEAEVAMHHDGERNRLQGALSTRDFGLGSLLEQPRLGGISLHATTEGVIDRESGPSLYYYSTISELDFNRVKYDSLTLSGTVAGKLYQASLHSASAIADFTLDATADMRRTVPRYDLSLDLRRADLRAMRLNLRDSVSLLALQLQGGITLPSINEMDGMAWISDAYYRYNDTRLRCDLFSVQALKRGEMRHLELESPYLDALFSSPSGYKDAFQALLNSLRSYLPDLYNREVAAAPADTLHLSDEDQTSLWLRVKKMTPITDALAQGLEVADSTILELQHNPSLGTLNLKLHSDYIERKNLMAMGISLSARSRGDSLMVEGEAGDLFLSSLHFREVALRGGAARNRFDLSARFADSLSRLDADFRLEGGIERIDTGRRFTLRLLPSKLSIGTDRWSARSEWITFQQRLITIDSFSLYNPHERLLLSGVASRSRADSLYLNLENFNISPLTSFAASMGYRIEGISNGSATMKSVLREGEISADIRIDSLKINEQIPVHPIRLLSHWDFEQNRANMFVIDRQRADTAIRGYYRPSDNRYYARARIDYIPMQLLNPILKGVISDTQGSASADLTLMGEGRKAELMGSLDARDLSTRVDFTGVEYRLPEAHVAVADNRLVVRDVEIFDREQNSGRLNFTLDLNRLSNISYQLRVAPQRMLVLNTTAKDNDLFYGKIYASGTARISGDKMGVSMNVNASTEDNSTFFMPLSGSSNVGKADFVTFRSAAELDTTDYLVRKRMLFERKNRRKSASGGNMDINLELNVHPNLDFQLVIDPAAGDVMRGRGEGLLNIHVNPRDNVFEMMGDYTITEGSYLFTLQNVINKKFILESGSTIQWTGEPMDAMLNINAIYNTRASLQPLLGASTSADRNAYTRQVPVECVIHLGDRLTNPSKTFNIRVPHADSETQAAVNNILNTETTVARQFIYLVAFNSFYPENSTASSDNIGAVASAATGFELLSNQLTRLLSGDAYNITFNYRPETELTGDEVDFGLSTNLVNGRLFIELEGNYVLDNKQAINQKVSNFMGEAYITWLIDRSGNLKLRGFTQTIDRFDETQGLQETGIGIYYKEDFDNWKDLKRRIRDRYKRKEERKKERREERRVSREQLPKPDPETEEPETTDPQ